MYFTDTEIMDSTIENMYIEQNLLLWSSRGGADDIPEFIRRPKPSSRQPLAPDLSLQQEEVKHGEYATHILLQKQTREYASAVEDSILLLKRGTEEMVKCLTDWKGSPEFMRDYKNFPHDGKCFDELTHIGKEVLFMSETIKNLHNENAVAFWTSGYREAIFRRLISFSKDIVKLRRKLGRIKNSLKERVGSIRKVVLKYGIETCVVENLVPPGIYHEWVKEDMNLLEETDNQQQGQGTGKSKMKAESVRKIMNNVITNYFDDPYGDSEESVDCNDSSSANITAFKSLYQRKYQMRKDIEILHKEDRSKNVTESSFEGVLGHLEIPPSSSNPLVVVSTKESSRLEIKSWVGTLSPSNIVLETIASNINPSIHYKHKSNQIEKVMENEDTELSEAAIWHQLTSEHEDDVKTILPRANNEELVNTLDVAEQQSSCIHVVPTQNHNVISVGEETKTMGIPLENNENIVTASVSFKDKPQVVDECLVNLNTKETTVIFASDSILKEYESFNEDGSTTYVTSTARAEANDDCVLSSGTPSEVPVTKTFPVPKTLPPASELATFSSCGTSSIKNSLSKSMAQQISTLKVTIENIHETAQQTTYSIREVERSWLNPSQHIIPSRRQKELFQHLDFIVDTVVLLNKPSFASRLYKEDQYEIVAVLDPVFREVTTCYVTLCELHDRVMVDTKYLKQLVSGFPKGSLVIQDWVRDPIDDEDEVGQHQYSSDLDVDVEELFA